MFIFDGCWYCIPILVEHDANKTSASDSRMINLSFFTVKLLIEFGYMMNQYRLFLKRCFYTLIFYCLSPKAMD